MRVLVLLNIVNDRVRLILEGRRCHRASLHHESGRLLVRRRRIIGLKRYNAAASLERIRDHHNVSRRRAPSSNDISPAPLTRTARASQKPRLLAVHHRAARVHTRRASHLGECRLVDDFLAVGVVTSDARLQRRTESAATPARSRRFAASPIVSAVLWKCSPSSANPGAPAPMCLHR